jgi:predicted TPR repeat methyltransferase
MNTTVSILAEIPEELHMTLAEYLETHADWDQDRVFAAALSLFLLQNRECNHQAALVYLDALFDQAV